MPYSNRSAVATAHRIAQVRTLHQIHTIIFLSRTLLKNIIVSTAPNSHYNIFEQKDIAYVENWWTLPFMTAANHYM